VNAEKKAELSLRSFGQVEIEEERFTPPEAPAVISARGRVSVQATGLACTATADGGSDLVEDCGDISTQQTDRNQANHSDQCHHQAILDHGSAFFLGGEVPNAIDEFGHLNVPYASEFESDALKMGRLSRPEAHRVGSTPTEVQVSGLRLAWETDSADRVPITTFGPIGFPQMPT